MSHHFIIQKSSPKPITRKLNTTMKIKKSVRRVTICILSVNFAFLEVSETLDVMSHVLLSDAKIQI